MQKAFSAMAVLQLAQNGVRYQTGCTGNNQAKIKSLERIEAICVGVDGYNSRRYAIGLPLAERDFEKLSSPHLGEKPSEIRDTCEKEEARAKLLLRRLYWHYCRKMPLMNK